MCVIVDANLMSKFFLQSGGRSLDRLFRAISTGSPHGAVLTYGGKLTREYRKSPEVVRILSELDRGGRAKQAPDTQVDTEEATVRALGACRSDDEHIVALARVSRARLLCSDDKYLRADFRDRHLVPEPRGRLYAKKHHDTLLATCCGPSADERRSRRLDRQRGR